MMVAIPLGLVGVLPGHFLFGRLFYRHFDDRFHRSRRNHGEELGAADRLRAPGTGRRSVTLLEAVVAAGAIRIRPILLTAGTVVVGAVVILFDPIFQGLAIALMFGALASTALTLLVVPVLALPGRKPLRPLSTRAPPPQTLVPQRCRATEAPDRQPKDRSQNRHLLKVEETLL